MVSQSSSVGYTIMGKTADLTVVQRTTIDTLHKWRKTNLEVFRIAWKNIMSSYRQALKTARTEYIRKLIDNHQNNPRFLFSTVARLTNKQMSPDLNIPSQFNSNDFMNFFLY